MAGIAMLLGAGASVDAGLPTTVGLIDKLLEHFKVQAEQQPLRAGADSRLLEFIVHGLRQDAVVRGDRVGLDVETMFEAIETLANRNQLSIAPFISTWHPLISQAERISEAWRTPEQRLGRLLQEAIQKGVQGRGPFATSSGTRESERFVRELLGSETAGSAFAGLALAVLASLVWTLRIDDRDRTRYLEPIVNLYRTQGELAVATLNYDLAIETMGDLFGVAVDTGMDVWHLRAKLEFSEGIRLLKLHGSIDWHPTQGVRVSVDEPFIQFEGVERTPGQITDRPALIFGAGNKLRAGGPYLELLRQFDEVLARTSALVVVGYSFRDAHVNAVLTTWMNADVTRRMVVLDKAVRRFGTYSGDNFMGLGYQLSLLARRDNPRVRFLELGAADGLERAIATAQKPFVAEPAS